MDKRFIHNSRVLKERRKLLRKNTTPQEKVLWYLLRNKNLGFKFFRQHSIGHYIVDFYCKEKKLIIELDGSQHQDNQEYDIERTRYLEMYGYRVLRFSNNEVNSNRIVVMAKIQECLTT
jgi:very-short-patch-repair endonuclease